MAASGDADDGRAIIALPTIQAIAGDPSPISDPHDGRVNLGDRCKSAQTTWKKELHGYGGGGNGDDGMDGGG